MSNQVDNVQRNVGELGTRQNFVNTLRTEYCSIQGTDHIRSFLSADTPWIHDMINGPEFDDVTIDGVRLRERLANATASPATLTDLVEPGTLETDFPGVLAFPCPVGP